MIGFICAATTFYGWDAASYLRQSRGLEAPTDLTIAGRWGMAALSAIMFGWGLTSIFWS